MENTNCILQSCNEVEVTHPGFVAHERLETGTPVASRGSLAANNGSGSLQGAPLIHGTASRSDWNERIAAGRTD